ncbi:MAG: hypothetical protein H0W12_05400 [Chitinophagaceae bacterium]|nr:hypothetical protein [Chitinophagaceae bacterium]
MKKVIFTFISVLMVMIVFAQKDTVRLREIQKNSKGIVTDRAPQAVYFQIGGSAPLLSVNYDRRFYKKVNGLGFAIGVGFFGESGINIFSVPFSINYLIGHNSHFVEVAAGTTFVSATSDLFDTQSDHASGFIHHINLGYRYQPSRGGFFFRGGFSPLFYQSEYAMSYYIGFGHNF